VDATDSTRRTGNRSGSRRGNRARNADTVVVHGAAVRDAHDRRPGRPDFSGPEWTASTHAVRCGVIDR